MSLDDLTRSGADPDLARRNWLPICMDAGRCVRVREALGLPSDRYCMYADYSLAITGVVTAPSCAERPGGLALCSAGCECDPGYECGAYSEAHPWVPCYPTGTLVPRMPFDGAWMTRILTSEEAARAGGTEIERHYVDPAYCDAVAAQFPGGYTCDSLPPPAS